MSRNSVHRRKKEMKADKNLIKLIGSFLSDRCLQLVIDGLRGNEVKIEIGVPQEPAVSPILFAIYLSGIFEVIKDNTNKFSATWFTDDYGLLVKASNTPELVERLQKAGNLAVR